MSEDADRLPALDPAVAEFVDDFATGTVDPTRWVGHYLPHWTTDERSRARWAAASDGLELRIEADQLDWRPEDAPMRVSNLQTATFSGPVGSPRGTHRHRSDGLVVRTATPLRVLWAARSGQVEVTVSASTGENCMLAIWLVGTEHEAAEQSGEICVVEIDADAIGASSARVRTGIKAHHDRGLATNVAEVEVPVRADHPHTWSTRWDGDGVVVACEGRVVHRSQQVLRYPLQLMVDLFEIGAPGPPASYPRCATIHRVVAQRLS